MSKWRPPLAPDRESPLAALYARTGALAAKLGDPLLAAFEAVERLTDRQAQEMFALVLADGAPCAMGLAFSPAEADLLQVLSARLGQPLTWQHVYVHPHGGMSYGEGRYVESIYSNQGEKESA